MGPHCVGLQDDTNMLNPILGMLSGKLELIFSPVSAFKKNLDKPSAKEPITAEAKHQPQPVSFFLH